MRIFKMIEADKWPSYRNLLKEYGPVLGNEHPVLAYMMNNEDSLKKVHNFKNIYMFISKILKASHFKITRNYAKVTSLRTFVNEYFNDDLEVRE